MIGSERYRRKRITAKMIFILVIVIAAVFFACFIYYWLGPHKQVLLIKSNVAKVHSMENGSVARVDSKISKIDAQLKTANSASSRKAAKAALRRKFQGTAIIGDSITEGLVSYDVLGTDIVIFKRGVGLSGAHSLLNRAKGLHPKIVFLSFGTNDLITYRGHPAPFIEKYKSVINYSRKIMPHTRICINCVLPIKNYAIKRQHSLGAYGAFNTAMKKMCKQEKLTFIDSSFIVREHPKFDAGDGIHQGPAFYPLWLTNMASKAGLQ